MQREANRRTISRRVETIFEFVLEPLQDSVHHTYGVELMR